MFAIYSVFSFNNFQADGSSFPFSKYFDSFTLLFIIQRYLFILYVTFASASYFPIDFWKRVNQRS